MFPANHLQPLSGSSLLTAQIQQDLKWMQHAMQLARQAEQQGEVPVGAVVVKQGMLVGEGWNQPIRLNDPTAHAEMMAIRDAGQRLNNYRLNDCTLYVTLEPCAMCTGAMVHSRISRLVFGAQDPRTGAAGSVFQLADNLHLNHRMQVVSGVMAESSQALLQQFFRRRRAEQKAKKQR